MLLKISIDPGKNVSKTIPEKMNLRHKVLNETINDASDHNICLLPFETLDAKTIFFI